MDENFKFIRIGFGTSGISKGESSNIENIKNVEYIVYEENKSQLEKSKKCSLLDFVLTFRTNGLYTEYMNTA